MAFRSQILQLATPNALRGRVTAAEQLFTGGGPQAGQIEAGAVAARFGASFAVVSGGDRLHPQRRADRLADPVDSPLRARRSVPRAETA